MSATPHWQITDHFSLRNSPLDRSPRLAKTASVQQSNCLCWSESPPINSSFRKFTFRFQSSKLFNELDFHCSHVQHLVRTGFLLHFMQHYLVKSWFRQLFGYCIFLRSTKSNAGPPKLSSLMDRLSINSQSTISKTAAFVSSWVYEWETAGR